MKLDKAPLHWMAAICLTLGTIGVIYYFEKKKNPHMRKRIITGAILGVIMIFGLLLN